MATGKYVVEQSAEERPSNHWAYKNMKHPKSWPKWVLLNALYPAGKLVGIHDDWADNAFGSHVVSDFTAVSRQWQAEMERYKFARLRPTTSCTGDCSVYSPSDSKHWFKYLTFLPDTSTDMGGGDLEQTVSGQFSDVARQWLDCWRRKSVPSRSAINNIFHPVMDDGPFDSEQLELQWWDQLPLIPAVTKVINLNLMVWCENHHLMSSYILRYCPDLWYESLVDARVECFV
ncbi:hypothetical protein M440DRAFT_1459473 [Trichoderma longibrachiatum ATCC 18648]|uniref:Uncharacterized protein n=1 Tax=Trichoderma longibrachiatum ATCC 18648 TaxID=983965 RepID=A0A2T4CI39_TRILO|nr:hypothetical protein M440DRAFT_1459473 [Trichoderma longibrachiatum ATCC 18648]